VDDSVAVWANGSEVANGINYDLFADTGERRQVVDVDEAIDLWAVLIRQGQTASNTDGTVVRNARFSCQRVSLISAA